jgi:hypothetical protein
MHRSIQFEIHHVAPEKIAAGALLTVAWNTNICSTQADKIGLLERW